VLSSRTSRSDDVGEFDVDTEIFELLLELLARRSCVVRNECDVLALFSEEGESLDDVFGTGEKSVWVSVEGFKAKEGSDLVGRFVEEETHSLSPAGPVQITPSH